MKRRYKYGLIGFATFVALSILAIVLYRGEVAFQHDADIVRLQHLKYYGLLIEEYHDKTGKYPFQGRAKIPVYVHIAQDTQQRAARKGPPYPHELLPFSTLVSEIEAALGHPIEEHYDPQYYPVNKPSFYVYMVHNDAYFFAVHLDEDFPFAEKLGDHYSKAEISNVANEENKALTPTALFADPEFVKAVTRPLAKPGFFQARERKYLHFTKQ